MNGKETDNKIQKITKLLEKGGTMLATHHECGAPLFRYQGKTVCPVCDFQEKQEVKQEKKQEPPQKIQTPQAPSSQEINRIIMGKIQNIAASLEAETDLARVKVKMECIEQGIRILKLLKD
ncbi:MAG: Sjogren's syndrome/scleroderma autoantigen 1 family protein [Candidatus Methanoperedens sp.]|nr:Sjogren's syndrome/scleroderma autoantigen 1 family protein [Candidatus Methanoperedens sp.]